MKGLQDIGTTKSVTYRHPSLTRSVTYRHPSLTRSVTYRHSSLTRSVTYSHPSLTRSVTYRHPSLTRSVTYSHPSILVWKSSQVPILPPSYRLLPVTIYPAPKQQRQQQQQCNKTELFLALLSCICRHIVPFHWPFARLDSLFFLNCSVNSIKPSTATFSLCVADRLEITVPVG